MAFFDDFSKHMDKIKKGAQKTAELAKMQHQIGMKQTDFDKLFSEIGKLYYSDRQRGVQPDETMDALLKRVDELAAEISEMKKKVDELRQVNRCPECGSEQPSSNAFCSACGAKLPQKSAAEEAPADASSQEEENRDVYINWPDGSAKEEPAKEAADVTEQPAGEETAEESAAQEAQSEEENHEESEPNG